MDDEPLELSVTRYIDAPPARVWQATTERQEEWWCPAPWRAEIVTQEWRAGGRSEMVFKGPDGEEMPQNGTFLEVTPGVRFVATDAAVRDANGEWRPSGPFQIGIWEIAPEGSGTRYTARSRHWTRETLEQHRDMGFVEGWTACADGLARLCEEGDDA
jgi:uncharacterized protein YndB with AHSA1/START domain